LDQLAVKAETDYSLALAEQQIIMQAVAAEVPAQQIIHRQVMVVLVVAAPAALELPMELPEPQVQAVEAEVLDKAVL
jgi:hypothetical protein